jgi:hypothetical protein
MGLTDGIDRQSGQAGKPLVLKNRQRQLTLFIYFKYTD